MSLAVVSERAADGRDAARGSVRLGAVLCGGASRRMGTDKALLELDGELLLARALRAVRPVADEVVLATGAADAAGYARFGVERVADRAPGLGPLGGLEAVLERLVAQTSESELVALVACDMPRLAPELIEALAARCAGTGADACLFASASGVEPLLAVYRGTCLGPVRDALARGERRMIAFHGDVRVVTLSLDELAPSLAARLGDAPETNLNTREDLDREARR